MKEGRGVGLGRGLVRRALFDWNGRRGTLVCVCCGLLTMGRMYGVPI